MKRTDITDPYLDLFLSSSTGAFLILPHHPALWTQRSSSFLCALDLWLVCLSVIMIQIIYKNIRPLPSLQRTWGNCWVHLPAAERCPVFAPSTLQAVSGWGIASFSESTVPLTHTASSHSSKDWGEDKTRRELGSRARDCRVWTPKV